MDSIKFLRDVEVPNIRVTGDLTIGEEALHAITDAEIIALFTDLDSFDTNEGGLIDEPTMYLYGHEADKTVTYNGVELPELPEWDREKYPYVAIFFMYDPTDNLPVRSLFFLDQPGTVGVANMWVSGGCSVLCYEIRGDEFEWRFVNESYVEAGKNICTVTSNMLTLPSGGSAWANHDIMYSNGTTYLSATDPVITYENADVTINGVGYVGAVLPKLPTWDKEQYPYAVIAKYTAVGMLFGYDLVVSNKPLFMSKGEYPHLWQPSGTNSSTAMYAKLYFDSNADDITPMEWGNWGNPYDSYTGGAIFWNEPIWANYDIELCDGNLNPMGETALSETEPIPIYE